MVAQGIVNLAKADQVLTSAPTLEAVPTALRAGSRPFDSLEVPGRAGEVEIVELIWDLSDSTLDGRGRAAQEAMPDDSPTCVVLTYKGQEYVVNEDRSKVKMGRQEGNDIVVIADLVSRVHADVKLRRGRIKVTDNSANGTVIVYSDGRTTTLRREHDMLKGTGTICLGGSPEDNPDGVIHFACE